MSNATMTVDARQVLKLFSALSSKQQQKVYKQTLTDGAKILVKETKSQLKATGIKGINHKHPENNNMSLNKGISFKVKKDVATVNIMKDYRLRFFEKGTEERGYKSKHGRWHKTGRLKPKYFFKTAKNLKITEIEKHFQDTLTNNIIKIARKNK